MNGTIPFFLARRPALEYDFNHMLPEPYDLLPTTARQSQTIAAGDVLFRQGARTLGLYVLKTGCRVALNCEMRNPTKSTALLCP